MGQVRAGEIDIAYDVHGDGSEGTVLLVCGTAVPEGRYVETPGVSHVSIDPDSLQLQMTALLEFLAVSSRLPT